MFPCPKKLLFIPLALLLLLVSCRKGTPSWDAGFLFPLAHASLSIDDLVTDSLITTGADGSVRLVYSNQFLGLTDSLLSIPDTTVTQSFSVPFGSFTFQPGDWITPTNTLVETTYQLGTIELVYGILADGQISLVLKNDVRRRVILHYEIPCATRNGNPFDTSFVVPAAPDSLNAAYGNATISLVGYAINFTGINGDRVNTLTTKFYARIDPTETGPATVYNSDTVAAINTFTGIRPEYIRGYFGSEMVQAGPEETGMSLFSRVTSGALGLDSLTMNLTITNYVGMDARLTINSLWTASTLTGQNVYLANSVIGSPLNINRATYSNSFPPSLPAVSTYSFNNGNSNARALVENLPDRLGYDISILTNPLGNVSGNNDFYFGGYGINARLDVELPLNFHATQLTIADTIETSFASIEDRENILQGRLNLFAQNSFPFSASIQIYLLDANGLVIDSIVPAPGQIAAGATANVASYIVSQGFVNSQIIMPLTPAQTQSLLNSSRLYFKAIFDTNSAPAYVKIFSTNRLDLQLSADFDYHFGD